MSKLIITGKKSYTTRMFKHLKKEHPSTRHRMILRDKDIFSSQVNTKHTTTLKTYDGIELKKGNMFHGILITRISNDGQTITGLDNHANLRTIHYTGHGWEISNKHLKK